MKEMRKFCADSPYGMENCPYAKVVEEEGNFPVTIEIETIDPDGKKTTIVKEENETCRWAVYCKHPRIKKKLIGTVEPYGGYCYVPIDCPELHSNSEVSICDRLKRIKEAFFR